MLFPQLGTFGLRGSSVEVKKESIGSNVSYQPGAFKGKSRFFQSTRGGKSAKKGCGQGFIKRVAADCSGTTVALLSLAFA